MEARDETGFWRTTASLYQHELDAASFAGRASETVHRGYGALAELEAFVQASGTVFQFPRYSKTLPQQSFGHFLELTQSTFENEDEMEAKENRTL